MTATDTERQAFERQIRETPADDTVRLVYADWLDEHGESERAEFVRVQVSLARLPEPAYRPLTPGVGYHTGLGVCPACARTLPDRCRYHGLAVRESALWRPNHARWFGDGTGANCLGSCLTPNAVDPRVSRGFVWRVELPLAAFLEHAPALFAAHPIEAVVLIDREPWDHGGTRASWYNTDRIDFDLVDPYHSASDLPPELFALLNGDALRDSDRPVTWYPSAAGALAALSAACVTWGRSLAGLPPL